MELIDKVSTQIILRIAYATFKQNIIKLNRKCQSLQLLQHPPICSNVPDGQKIHLYSCQKSFFFFKMRHIWLSHCICKKRRPNVNMTSFFSRNRRDLKREGYKDPIRSHLRSPCEGNYNLYESARQKK